MGAADRPIDILLVEDNPGDIRLTREALHEGAALDRLSVVQDGEAALHFLRREGQYRDACPPDLILLDLGLPGKNGREVLAEIKADPRLKSIPVVILTTSLADDDVRRAYALNASSYVTKPRQYQDFVDTVKTLHEFWRSIVTLPGAAAARPRQTPVGLAGGPPASLRLEVKLMVEPALWRWDIRDAVQDRVVRSSWSDEWTAYVSREEAERAGRQRLALTSIEDQATRLNPLH